MVVLAVQINPRLERILLMNKPNYLVKSYILNERNDLLQNVRTISKAKYKSCYGIEPGRFLGPSDDIEYCLELEKSLINENGFLYKEAQKINKADLNRNVRLKKRIAKYLNMGQCLFLTFTFNDECLDSTTEETRRKYVRRWLKSYSSYYVANIDFGSKNDREHYHALICVDRVDLTKWNHGTINVKRVKPTSDGKALAKYISKLTNHAIKETTKRYAIIYGEV